MLFLILGHTFSKATPKKKILLSTDDILKSLKTNPVITWQVSVSLREMGVGASEKGAHVQNTELLEF